MYTPDLSSNALKFTDKGHVQVSVRDEGSHVQCVVSDTGPGIAQDDLPKVFGEFQQFGDGAGHQGSGLGLAICKNLVELHRGVISVESTLHEGTRFILRLPRMTPKELFLEQVERCMATATKHKGSLAILTLRLNGFDQASSATMQMLHDLVLGCLRGRIDRVVRDEARILVLLPHVTKEDAALIAERITKLAVPARLELECHTAHYPHDVVSLDALLKAVLL